MSRKKPQSLLGLPPLTQATPSFGSTSLVRYTGSNAITPRERAILAEVHEDKLVIEAFDTKGKFGLEKMNEMKWFAANDFWYTVSEIAELRQEAQGTSCQGVMDEFCDYLTKLAGRHTLGVVEITAGKIAETISESVLPPPPPPPPPKGLLARLFGG